MQEPRKSTLLFVQDAAAEPAALGAFAAEQPALALVTADGLDEAERARSVVLVQDAFTSFNETPLVLDVLDLLLAIGARPFVAPYRRPSDGPAVLTFSVTATDDDGATSAAATVTVTVPVHPEWWFTPEWASFGPRVRTAL